MRLNTTLRLRCVEWFGRGAFLLLLVGLAYLQLWRGSQYRALAQRNAVRLVPIEAPRGDIVDRQGHILATSRLRFDIAIVPQDTLALEFTLQRLAELTERSVVELRQMFARHRGALPFVPSIIVADASLSLVAVIEEHRHELPGVVVTARPQRHYPHGPLAAHVLGYIGPMDPQEYARRRRFGARLQEWVGKSGVEASYDAYLRGVDGGLLVEVDHRGRQVRLLNRRDPAPGQTLVLTLDAELQQLVEEQFADRAGACIVLQPQTGDVLALASLPAFAPESFIATDRSATARLLRDPRRPLLNRAIHGNFPPGSIFKIVTSVAALEDRKITPVTTFACGGSLTIGGRAFHCWKRDGHGLEFLRRGLTHSCNSYFMQLGLAVGADRLAHWAHRFGLGQTTGIDLDGEQRGMVPTRSWKQQRVHEAWFDGDTANMAIGQGAVLLTPLQAARMMAAVVNGGWLVTPRVARRIGALSVAAAPVRSIGVAPSSRQAVIEGLIDVVASAEGTGHRAWKPGLSTGGKTGTAQTHPPLAPHAWMIGFTPVEQPEVVYAILVEHGGSGGHWPALLAQRIAEVLEVRRQALPAPRQAGARAAQGNAS